MDIIEIALNTHVKQIEIIEFISILRNEVKAKMIPDGSV